MPIFLLVCTLCWIAGLYPMLFGQQPWETIVFPAGAGVMSFLFWRMGQMSLRQSGCAMLLIVISLFYHSWYVTMNVSRIAAHEGQLVRVQGVIASQVDVDGDRAAFVVLADHVELAELGEGGDSGDRGERREREDPDGHGIWRGGKERLRAVIRLQSIQEQQLVGEFRQGMKISFTGQLSRPQQAGNWDAFDYREYLRRQNIHWSIETKGLEGAAIAPANRLSVHRGLANVHQVREKLAGRIHDLYGEPYGGLMRSMVIGHREHFDEEQNRKFSHVGLAHILAVSGMHVGIFCAMVLFVLRCFRVTKESSLVICILLLPVYVLLTGAAPPVLRAGLMAAVGMELARRNKLRHGLHLLSAAAFVMLVWNPYWLADIGFQLSFLITAGLILGVQKVYALLPIRGKALKSTVAVTVVAQCTAFPLTIYYFNSFSLLSFPANLVLAPLLSVVSIPLGMFALAVSYVHLPAARFAAQVGNEINEAVFAAIDWMLRIDPWGTVFASPPVWWMAAYYCLLAFILQAWSARGRYIGLPLSAKQLERRRAAWAGLACGSAALLLLLVAYAYDPGRWDPRATVSFLDVGQGDAILVKTPRNRHILIDSGGTARFIKQGEEWRKRQDPYEIGNDLLVPLLKRRGVRELDYLVLTHADHDHIGGALAIVEQLRVHHLVFNGTLRDHGSAKALFKAAVDKGIRLYAAERGKQIELERDAHIVFLHPDHFLDSGLIPLAKEQNPVSTVMLVQLYGTKFLFTGDIDQETERDILQALRVDGVDFRLRAAFPRSSAWTLADQAAAAWPISDEAMTGGNLILKVAHHGSKSSTSQEWLEYWRPAHAVISAGANNPYGHPHPLVIDRLRENGVVILRTDLHGEVRYFIDRNGYQVKTKHGGVKMEQVNETAGDGQSPAVVDQGSMDPDQSDRLIIKNIVDGIIPLGLKDGRAWSVGMPNLKDRLHKWSRLVQQTSFGNRTATSVVNR